MYVGKWMSARRGGSGGRPDGVHDPPASDAAPHSTEIGGLRSRRRGERWPLGPDGGSDPADL